MSGRAARSAISYRLSAISYQLIVFSLLSACHKSEEEAEVTPRVPVGITLTRSDTVTDVVTLVGRLAATPGGSALLTAPAPAVVRRVAVQLGTRVRPGTPLLELDAPDLLATARTAVAQAELAERDAARQKDLLAQGITSQKQYEERTAAAVSARAAANAAQALLGRMRVKSPIAGAVQAVAVHPGERVDAGATLIEVINSTTLDFQAQVPAASLARLKLGQLAVVLPEGASAGAPGKVAALAPAVDTLTNSGQAIIRVPNPQSELRPGAGATARVTVGAPRLGLVVPDSALVVLGDSLNVFVVGPDSVAHARVVTVGVRRGGRAEIVRGLQPGERVVSSGAFGLTDGIHVVPTQAPASAAAPSSAPAPTPPAPSRKP